MNTQIKHTPGPWAVCNWMVGNNVPTGETTVCGPNGDEHICTMDGNENNQANAHIIAAAPAMYEALLWAKQYLRMPNFHHDNSYNAEQWAGDYNKLCEALAQAEGK